jgi:hypothetical protein
MHEHDARNMEPGAEPGAEFGSLIRSSLERYADPGPNSGLAERVMARIAVEQAAEKLNKLGQFPERHSSGAKAPTHLLSFIGTTKVVPFYKAFLSAVRTSFSATREAAHDRTSWTIRWVVALPVAACLIVALVLLASKTLHNSADGANQAHATSRESINDGSNGSTASLPVVPAQHNVFRRPERHSSRARATVSAAPLPKLDVFPTPQPLTREEQALVAYVAHAPQAERKSLIEDQRRMDAPLTIEALEIKPLALPEPEGN